MATILSVGNSEGERRCDAKCHEATGPQCDCICGGAHHGVGSSMIAQQRMTKGLLGNDWEDQALQMMLKGEATNLEDAIFKLYKARVTPSP